MNKHIAIVDIGSFTLPYDYYYINELVKQGYKIDFYCSNTKYNGKYINKLRNIGVNLYKYNISSTIADKWTSFKEYIKFMIHLIKNYRKYKRIHFMWVGLWAIEIILFLFLRRKLIFTFHNHIPHSKNKPYFPYKFIFNIAQKVIFASCFTRDEFFKTYKIKKIDQKKAYCIPHGLLSFDGEIKEKNTFEQILIFWGNVKEYKGVDFFLEIIKDERFKDWKIEIYGKWDKKIEHIKLKLQKHNVKIIDKFLSEKEIIKILSKRAIFILPYKKATQSGIFYTLLNYCKVFIAKDVGDIGMFLKKEKLDRLIFYDINTFYGSLNYAKKNYINLKNELCRIKKDYSWDRIMTNINEVYE